MNVPKPMLAVPLHKGNIIDWNDWVAEEKYDGVRVVIRVTAYATGRSSSGVTAYTRPKRSTGNMDVRLLPMHLTKQLALLPDGVYDGELLAGDTATDVTRTDLEHERRVVLFDILELRGISLRGDAYKSRRLDLESVYLRVNADPKVMTTSSSVRVRSMDDVARLTKTIWKTGGEGLILKRMSAPYQSKRSPDFIKVKRVSHAVLTVVGFEPSRGTVMGRGDFAIVKLRDDDGNETTVKTKNDVELDRFNKQWQERCKTLALAERNKRLYHLHPAIGQRLMIEFPQRTRTGGYQGPVIWDRWDDE